MKCPLCESESEKSEVLGPFGQHFLLCSNCKLVFRYNDQLVGREEEKSRYLTHKNSIQDQGYVDFLLSAYSIAKQYISKDQYILDYGCGYAPVFTELMKQKAYHCDHYDPIFFENGISQSHYPVIFCIETAEHFHHPKLDWAKLNDLLETGGILTVMTDMWTNIDNFPSWHYMKDETHTSFYHPDTMKWIAGNFNWTILDTDEQRRIVFKKNEKNDQ